MKRGRKKIVVAGIIIVAFVLAMVLLFLGTRKSAEKNLLRIMPLNVDLQMKNVIYTDVGKSGEKWEIKADSARYLKKENVALFDNVKVRMVMPSGSAYTMRGDKGKFKTDTRDMEITGSIVITGNKGDRLITDRLAYSDAEKKIHTASPITMQNSKMEIKGVGMVFSLKNYEVRLLSRVRAQTK